MTHPHLLLHILVRWLDFITLVALLGGFTYRWFVWTPLSRRLEGSGRETAGRLPIKTLLVILSATSLTDLVLRASMMSGRPLPEVYSVLPLVLSKTHFGQVWAGRCAAIAFLAVVQLLGTRVVLGVKTTNILSLIGGAVLGLATTLSGHAADLGSWTWTVLLDWGHVMAVSAWVGGLFALRLHLRPVLAGVSESERREFLATAIRRFSTMAMTAVFGILLTGVYNTYVHVHSLSLLSHTDYGRILILKWSLIIPMALLGGVSRFYVLPILEHRNEHSIAGILSRAARAVIETVRTRPQNMERLFFRLILIEALLGLMVLGCSATITQLPPPHKTSVGFEHSHHAM